MKASKVYDERMKICGGRCEYCGEGGALEMHHILDKDGIRRKKYESVHTVRMLCPECHRGKDKYKAINFFRRQLDIYYRNIGKTDDEIREITGRKLHVF